MTVTDGEFIVIFDCDHVPSCDFLLSTMGWLVKDPKIALVQTPHHFYSPDPFEKICISTGVCRLKIRSFTTSFKGQRHVECHHVLRVFCRHAPRSLK